LGCSAFWRYWYAVLNQKFGHFTPHPDDEEHPPANVAGNPMLPRAVVRTSSANGRVSAISAGQRSVGTGPSGG
jgi:hypothetical protein